ncbi:MAG: 50S ribosomal protein L22 [Candidatus Babeliales bacterium]
MQFVSKAKFVRYSPYKLRPYADVIRGKDAHYALAWLSAHENQRVTPLKKAIKSAIANAHSLKGIAPQDLCVKDLRVDQGPIFKYFKPGAMGRATVLRKRFSHISVVLVSKQKEV